MRNHVILHTIETGGPGGAETVVLNLATKLNRDRFRSLVLLSEDGWLHRKLQQQGVPTFLVSWKAWYDFRLPRAIARLVRQEGVDLIHSHLPGQNFYASLAGRWTGCKTIVTYHGPVELRDAARRRAALKLWFVRNTAAAAVVVCDYVGDLLAGLGFPRSKLVRIYNGIDTAVLSHPPGLLRQELGLSNGTKVVGMIANLRQSKGYEFFVQAAHRVTQVFPDSRFLAVGDIDPVIGSRLQELVKDLALQERFTLLGFREDVPQILRDLDVFVLSSTSEGVPLVMLEAMAAGKPVVVTRCGGPQEIVEDGRTGCLVPPGDPESLAARIAELLQDPVHAAALGAGGRARAERDFSLARMVSDYEVLYTRLLGSA